MSTPIPVLEGPEGVFQPVTAGQLTSLDGKCIAPIAVVLHDSWSAEDRAKFGVHFALSAEVPAGQVVTERSFQRVAGVVREVVVTQPIPVQQATIQQTLTGSTKVAAGVTSSVLGAGFTSVTRVALNRLRFFFAARQPNRDYIAIAGHHTAADTWIRVSAKTEDYVEVRAGGAVESLEFSVAVTRVG